MVLRERERERERERVGGQLDAVALYIYPYVLIRPNMSLYALICPYMPLYVLGVWQALVDDLPRFPYTSIHMSLYALICPYMPLYVLICPYMSLVCGRHGIGGRSDAVAGPG